MNNSIPDIHPLAVSVVRAIKDGNASGLRQLLNDNPNIGETISLLITAGSDVTAGIEGADTEIPLHWVTSNSDVAAIEALMDGGANIDALGAVIAGGDPLENAISFQNGMPQNG